MTGETLDEALRCAAGDGQPITVDIISTEPMFLDDPEEVGEADLRCDIYMPTL